MSEIRTRCDRCRREIESGEYFRLQAVNRTDVACKSSTINVAVCTECWLDFLTFLGSGRRERDA